MSIESKRFESSDSHSAISRVELPVIVTSFRDFDLEERAVRLLAQMGSVIGDRKILGERAIAANEILVTDYQQSQRELPTIVLSQEMHHWSDQRLHDFFLRQFIPARAHQSEVVISSLPGQEEVRSDLIAFLNRSETSAIYAPFDERDLHLALIPTRREDEIERLNRFALAKFALFVLPADRKEIRHAVTFIEYRRRIHPHLDLAFIVVGGRKQVRNEIAAALEPFPIFWLSNERDELVRLGWPRRAERSERFTPILQWIGSRRGDARQPGSLLDETRRRRARPPFGVGGAVATTR